MTKRVVVACFIVTFLLAAAPRPARAASDPARTILIGALVGAVIGGAIGVIIYLARPKTSPTQNTTAAPTALGPRTGVDLRRLDVDEDPAGLTIAGGDAIALWHF
jgi:hypothetical protein